MTQHEFLIGDLAKATGTSPESIRHYEKIGLMNPPARSAANRRVYDQAAMDRLRFIRHSRELGFALDDIRILLDLSDHPNRDCAEADEIASARLAEVTSRIARLEALKKELERMIGACRHNVSAECRVIEVLSDHALCQHHQH